MSNDPGPRAHADCSPGQPCVSGRGECPYSTQTTTHPATQAEGPNMTEQIHLIAYNFLDSDTSGRDVPEQRIETDFGFFTDLVVAQAVVDRLNAPARVAFEARQQRFRAEHAARIEAFEAREREIAAIEAAGLVPSIDHLRNLGEFRDRTYDPTKADESFSVLTLQPGKFPLPVQAV